MDKKIEKRFDDVDKRFNNVDKRFNSVDKRLDGVDNRLNSIEADIKFLRATKVDKADIEEIVERVAGKKIDKVLKILDDQSKYFQEQEMLAGQVGRHDRWIHKIAGEIGTQLEHCDPAC